MEMVEMVWNSEEYSGNPSRIFALKLKALKVKLKAWNKNLGDSFKGKLEDSCRRIKELDLVEDGGMLSPQERDERECEKGDPSPIHQRGNLLEAAIKNFFAEGG